MQRTVWNRFFIGMALITSFALLIWIADRSVRAQNTTSGEWTASLSSKENKLQLNLERRNKGHRNQMGQTFEFSEFQGLTREQVQNGGPVSFSLVREAGRIDLEGTFQNGKGSGTFRFTGNASFISAMKSRGFDFEQSRDSDDDRDLEDRLFAATTLNVTTALADDLNSAGFGNLKTEDLFKAAIFKINSQFMREMKASGFQNLGMEELVKARIFKIDAEFVTEMRNEGLTDLQIEDLVKLRIFKIDTDFIRAAKADGVPLEVERLVQRKIGVARRD